MALEWISRKDGWSARQWSPDVHEKQVIQYATDVMRGQLHVLGASS